MNEFENLISLLESPNKENFSLGLVVAQNYKKEVFEYFGCELEDLEELTMLLERNRAWYREGSVFDITELFFEYKNLDKFPKAICVLKKLVRLELFGDKIQNIPCEIGNLKELYELILTGNFIKNLPTEIGNLTNLLDLRLNKNQLQSIPAEIGNLKRLRLLDLSENNLQNLPIEIGDLTSLEILSLNNNQIPESEMENIKKMLPNCYVVTQEIK